MPCSTLNIIEYIRLNLVKADVIRGCCQCCLIYWCPVHICVFLFWCAPNQLHISQPYSRISNWIHLFIISPDWRNRKISRLRKRKRREVKSVEGGKLKWFSYSLFSVFESQFFFCVLWLLSGHATRVQKRVTWPSLNTVDLL